MYRYSFLFLLLFSLSCSKNNTSDVNRYKSDLNKYKNKANLKYDGPEEYARILSYYRQGYPHGYKEIELKKMKNVSSSTFSNSNSSFGASASAVSTFKERGPFNVPGRTRAIVVDASDSNGNTWYAAGVGGGVWKTSNAGASWLNLTPDMENIAVVTLAQSSSQPNVLYAGTGESWSGNLDAIDGSGVFKSSDSGVTWTNVSPINSSGYIHSDFSSVSRVIVDPLNPDIVVASTAYKIYRSTNGGGDWTVVYSSSSGKVQQILSAPSNFNIQYASVNGGGIKKSEDAGVSWSSTGNFSISSFGRSEVAVSHSDPNVIYAATTGGGSWLHLSQNGGTSWQLIENLDGTADNWLNSQGWYDNCITINPFDNTVVYVGGIHTYKFKVDIKTKKKTIKWLTDGYGDAPGGDKNINSNVHVDHHFLGTIIDDENAGTFRILHGSDGGVAVSISGTDPGINNGEFTAFRNGYNTSQFYGADKVKGFHQYLGGLQDNGTWLSPQNEDASASTSYNFEIGGDGFEVIAHWDDPNKMMGSYQNNGHFRTINGGVGNWDYIGYKVSGSKQFISRLSTSYQDPDNVYVVTGDGIWKTFNFGETFHLASNSSDNCFSATTDLEVSKANPRYVWTGTRMSGGCNLRLSTDYGASFNPIANPSFGSSISGIYSHPTEDSTVYVLFSSRNNPKIIESKDLGQTWEDITGFSGGPSNRGFPNVPTYSLAVMPYDCDVIWAGTDIGLVETTDRGQTWNLVQSNLPHVSIWDMKVKDQGEVVIATHGRGIWTATIPDLVSYEPKPVKGFAPELLAISDGVNVNFKLRSNYDSIIIMADGVKKASFSSGLNIGNKNLNFSLTTPGSFDVQGVAYIDGYPLHSNIKSITILPNITPRTSYFTDFTSLPSIDFSFDGFVVRKEPGFDSDHLINEDIPYSLNKTYIADLNVPIIVTDNILTDNKPSMTFKEVVIVEPGDNNGLWDYVMVQARKKSGSEWYNLISGYDARANEDWKNAYNSSSNGDKSLYKIREIDFSPINFNLGDTLIIRFKLYSDEMYVGWGWAIDDLSIQPSGSDTDTDGDGVFDDVDLCPNTPIGETVDENGCSNSQLDDDGDGVFNDKDQCPNTQSGQIVDSSGCSDSQKDTDGDGVTDDIDICPNTGNGLTVDSNGCSNSQLDDDGDGVSNGNDDCPNTLNTEVVDDKGCPVPLSLEDKSVILKVYPIPAKDELVVELNDAYNIEKIEFVDFLGKVYNINNFSVNNNKIFVNVSYYNSGVYTLNIKTKLTLNSVRVIIER